MPARGEWVDLAPLERPVLAPLPELEYDDGSAYLWRVDTVALWEAWRQDPVSAQWSPADVAFAQDTIRLHNDGGAPNELRLRMDSLGLTPKGKRDLRWRIGEAKAQSDSGDRGRKPAAVRRLRAVG